MLRSCYRPLERCLSRRNPDGLLWHTDLKPHSSGDFSIAVVQANSSLEDQSQVYTSPSATYVGVYDGHGGPEASRFVNRRLFPYLHQFSKEHGGLSEDVIKKAFSATEEEFVHLVKRSFPVKPQIASVGSCCLVGAIADDVLYVANLGDSRAVLGRRVPDGQKSKVVAERLSTDHNVGSEEVRKEVEALHPDDSAVVVFCRGVWRIKGIIQESHDLSLGPMVPCSCEVNVAYYRERDVHGDLIQHNPTIPFVLCVEVYWGRLLEETRVQQRPNVPAIRNFCSYEAAGAEC